MEPTREGNVAVSLQGGAYASNGTLPSGSAMVRYGAAEHVELQLSGTFAWVPGLDGRPLSPVVLGGRIGVKHAVLRWLAFRGGVSSGGGPWGAWIAPDLGFVFAYENPEIVPFLAADVQLSLPVLPLTEQLPDTSGPMPTTISITPAPTFWFTPSLGFRIPLYRGDPELRASLLIAGTWTWARSLDDHGWGALGGEVGVVIEP